MFNLDLQETVHGPGFARRLHAAIGSRQAWRLPLSWIFALVGAPFVLLGITALTAFSNPSGPPDSLGDPTALVLLAFFLTSPIVGVLLLGIAEHFGLTWRLCNRQFNAADAEAKDPRPPILYLRPFKADRIRFSTLRTRTNLFRRFLGFFSTAALLDADSATRPTGEELIVSVIDLLGPVIAVGKPGESVAPGGAARLYLDDDEWQDVVREYMKRSQLILLFAGTTPHFAWEIEALFRNEPFVPTLMFLPFFRRYRQRKVDQFAAIFTEASGLELPENLEDARAVFFPNRAKVVVLQDRGDYDEQLLNSVNPFLAPVARFMELSRPEWSAAYLESATENRRECWWSIAVVLAYLGLQVVLIVHHFSS
jgi:hypothetical protein